MKHPESSLWFQNVTFTPGPSYDAQVFFNRYKSEGKIFDSSFFSRRMGALLFSSFLKMLPKAITASPTTSERLNVDNRFQTITISATTSVAAGDCFTIEGVYAVHQITKESTGQLKTFRVVSVVDGTDLVITPPIIDPSSDVDGEAAVQYQNCTRDGGAGSATAAITFLNIDAAAINPFWQRNAIELLPGRYVVDANTGAGVMRGTTDSGIELVMTKQFDINTYKTKYRLDTRFGVVNKAPEMSGILLFAQIASGNLECPRVTPGVSNTS